MSVRRHVDLLVFVLLAAAFLLAACERHDPKPPRFAQPAQVENVAERTVQGKGVEWWARHAVQARKDANARGLVLRRLRHARLVEFDPPYEHAATLAAIAYGVDAATLIRKGRCESGGWTRFHNPSGASGPWQFLLSTWAGTPFARFSPYDPLAAALAAAWMHHVGRGSEWVCR